MGDVLQSLKLPTNADEVKGMSDDSKVCLFTALNIKKGANHTPRIWGSPVDGLRGFLTSTGREGVEVDYMMKECKKKKNLEVALAMFTDDDIKNVKLCTKIKNAWQSTCGRAGVLCVPLTTPYPTPRGT
jgi:hypothetical protein